VGPRQPCELTPCRLTAVRCVCVCVCRDSRRIPAPLAPTSASRQVFLLTSNFRSILPSHIHTPKTSQTSQTPTSRPQRQHLTTNSPQLSRLTKQYQSHVGKRKPLLALTTHHFHPHCNCTRRALVFSILQKSSSDQTSLVDSAQPHRPGIRDIAHERAFQGPSARRSMSLRSTAPLPNLATFGSTEAKRLGSQAE